LHLCPFLPTGPPRSPPPPYAPLFRSGDSVPVQRDPRPPPIGGPNADSIRLNPLDGRQVLLEIRREAHRVDVQSDGRFRSDLLLPYAGVVGGMHRVVVLPMAVAGGVLENQLLIMMGRGI